MRIDLCLRFTNLPYAGVLEIINRIASIIRMNLSFDFRRNKEGDILAFSYPNQEGPAPAYATYRFTTIERAIMLFNEYYERLVVKSVRKPYPGKRPIRWHKRIF